MRRGAGILFRQVGHELRSLSREPITLVLSVGFPLLFFVIIASVVGNQIVDARQGIRLAQFLAPSFASFGVAMATFSFLAYGFAEARSTGVLKRQNGTPLPVWALLGGRMGAALILGLIASVLVVGVGVAAYDVQIIWRTLPAVLVTLVVASLAFSALGLAVAALASTPQFTLALTGGIVIPLGFISDIFMFGGNLPGWLSVLGWSFPLRRLVNALGDAFNPYLSGSGFSGQHLGVIVAWGVVGAAAAAWALRRERDRVRLRGSHSPKAVTADARPRHVSRPALFALLRDQMGHTWAVLWRDASSTFFAVIFPVLLVLLIPTVSGGGDILMPAGQTLGAFYALTMAVYGAGVTAFVNMPESVARARDQGVLKRGRGTPLPLAAMLGGRMAGALVVSVVTLVVLQAVASLLYGASLPAGWGTVLVVFLLACVCFSVVGLAVVSITRSAQAAIGVTLASLLTLSFFSDVFIVGLRFPDVLEGISWVFPLRHATRALTDAAIPGTAAFSLPWGHIGVLAAWTVAGIAVTAWRFRWEPPAGAGKKGKAAKGGKAG
jgi:ABC-type multidrug transport system permease subunit